jgi:hypothetical protein
VKCPAVEKEEKLKYPNTREISAEDGIVIKRNNIMELL